MDFSHTVEATVWPIRFGTESESLNLGKPELLYRVTDESLARVYNDVISSPLKDYPRWWRPGGWAGAQSTTWHFVGSLDRAVRIGAGDSNLVETAWATQLGDLLIAGELTEQEELVHGDFESIRDDLDGALDSLRGLGHPHVALGDIIEFVDEMALSIYAYESRK